MMGTLGIIEYYMKGILGIIAYCVLMEQIGIIGYCDDENSRDH